MDSIPLETTARQAYFFSSLCAASALSLLIYELILNFKSEVETIWPLPNSSWIKWFYFAMRYPVLAIQMLINVLARPAPSSCFPIRDMHQFSLMFLTLLVNIVLMAQVYVLYGRKLWLGAILFLVSLADVVGYALLATGPAVHIVFGAYCTYTNTPPARLVYTRMFNTVPAALALALILFKQMRETRAGNWQGRIPIITLLIRDTLLTFGILIGITVITVYGLKVNHLVLGFPTYYTTPLVSIVGCRNILNMQRFRPGPNSRGLLTTNAGLTRFSDVDSYFLESIS